MKKLMTMIAAVAAAFGLYADVATGTSFEEKTEGVSPAGSLGSTAELIKELTPATTQANYWDLSALSETVTATVTAYDGDGYEGEIPDQFNGTLGIYYLALKTGSSEVKRYYSDSHNPFKLGKTDAGKDGLKIFFDSVVKFTAFDSDPTIDDNAKAAVWLQEVLNESTQEPTATNLYVQVGGVKYDCGDLADLNLDIVDKWARVTIKAMTIDDSNEVLGFMVFVEKEAVAASVKPDFTGIALKPELKAFADAKKLFPAAGKAAEITSVGFQGQGSIDTIVFTDTAPDFAPDPQAYEIAWDTTHMIGVTISTNGHEITYTEVPVIVPGALPEGGVTFTWTGTSGKASGTKTIEEATDKAFTITEDMLDNAEAEFEGVPWTLTDAVAEANKADGTLKILAANVGAITLTGNFETTIDLNGKTVTQGATDAAAISAFGAITITGTGTVEGNGLTEGDYPACAVGCFDADCTIEGGTFNAAVGSAIVYKGGEFLVSANEKPTSALPEYEFVAKNGYWVLEKIQTYALSVVSPVTGGTVEIAPEAGNYAAGTEVKVTALANEGYSLKAITLNSAETADDTFNMPAEAVEVSAVFTGNVYTVAFEVDGGSAEVSPMEYTYNGTAITAPEYAGTKEGFEFAGCWTNVTDGGAAYAVGADLPVNVIGGYTLTAVWNKNQGWPVNPDDVKGQDAKTTFPGLPDAFVGADAGLVAAWAKDETKGNLAYDDMAEADIDAFLLDCAEDDVETEMAKFKIVSITADGKGDWIVKVVNEATGEGSVYGNGKIQLLGKTAIDAEGEWHAKTDTDTVFKAKLAPYRVSVE